MKKYLVLKENGKFQEIYEEDYKDSYSMLKENVGGTLEVISYIQCFQEKNIDLWIHDEGKLLDLLPTIALLDKEQIVDVISGKIVFAKANEEGETIPLDDSDIFFIKSVVLNSKGFVQYRNPYTGTVLQNTVSLIRLQ